MKTYNKAIYTYWNPSKNGAGFNSIEDFLCCFSLSVNVSLQHFYSIEVYTDSWGKELISKLDLPIIVNNELDCLEDVPTEFWAYSKIYSYSRQRVPFIHIDNDAILWDGIPDNMQDKSFVFQSRETFGKSSCYEKAINSVLNILPMEKTVKYGYNAGVFGSSDFNIIKEYESIAYKYITENKDFILNNVSYMLGQNILFEQYFIAYLIDKYKLNDSVGLLFEDDLQNAKFTGVYNYTHLWASSKKKFKIIEKVKNRLLKDYPLTYARIKG